MKMKIKKNIEKEENTNKKIYIEKKNIEFSDYENKKDINIMESYEIKLKMIS